MSPNPKPTFGDRALLDCLEKLKDPKVFAAARKGLAENQPDWCMPVQLRAFDEATIRAAVARVEGQA
jgi:hypothetical protein